MVSVTIGEGEREGKSNIHAILGLLRSSYFYAEKGPITLWSIRLLSTLTQNQKGNGKVPSQ